MPSSVSKVSVALQMCSPLKSTDKKSTYYVCGICNSTLSASNPGNITVHMENRHKEIFKEKYKKAVSKINCGEMEMRRLEILQSLTEIVTINGRPFSCLCDSGVQKLIRREINVLTESGFGAGLKPHGKNCPPAVLEHVEYLSGEVINAIKLEIKDRLISLMTDIGSRNKRDILGISIQYMIEGRVIIRSLGMIQFDESHTAENIKKNVMDCLKLFDVNPNQIVSITTDNASNMVSMIKKYNEHVEKTNSANDIATDTSPTSENDVTCEDDESNDGYESAWIIQGDVERIVNEYNEINSMSSAEIEAEERSADASEILDDVSDYINLLKELDNEFVMYTLMVDGVKCAAHTLQLAMKGALTSAKIRVLINVCRMVCKMLRKSLYKNMMRNNGFIFPLPRLDCKVRWNSTFTMVRVNTFFIFCQHVV